MASYSCGDGSELRSEWRLLLAATLGVGLGFPTIPFYSIGIFAPTLAGTFGWPLARILGGLALTPIALIAGPVVGYLNDRHGVRKIAVISLLLMGASYMTLALSNGSLVNYYASWAAIAVSGIGATPISFTRAINASFQRQRGMALGVTMAGTGLVALLIKPLGFWLMSVVGWRSTITLIGVLPIAIGAPIVWWGLKDEADNGPVMTKPQNPIAASMTVRLAFRRRAYWLLVVVVAPIAFATGAPLPNMESILRSVHLDLDDIAMLTSIIGVALVGGRLAGGWLIDRLFAPLVGAIILVGAALGCWLLQSSIVSYTQAIFAVVLLGFAGGVEVDLISYLVVRYIGVRSYGIAYGVLYALFAIGAGAGPSLLGHTYDHTGSYTRGMWVCGVLLLCSAGLLLFLGPYPSEERSAAKDVSLRQ